MKQRLRRIHLAIRTRLQQWQMPPQKTTKPLSANVPVNEQHVAVSVAVLAALKQVDVQTFVPSIEGQQTRGKVRRLIFGTALTVYDFVIRLAKRGVRVLRRIAS
jgi:hypothetical protein